MLSSSQATQISVRFVCLYVWSTVPLNAVSNRFSRCLDHCFRSFRSLFESISIDYKTLELNYFVFETFYLLPFLASATHLKNPLIFCQPLSKYTILGRSWSPDGVRKVREGEKSSCARDETAAEWRKIKVHVLLTVVSFNVCRERFKVDHLGLCTVEEVEIN